MNDRIRVGRAEIERLHPQPGDVLVLRWSEEDAEAARRESRREDALSILSQWVVDNKLDRVLIVALGEGQELAVADEEQMRAAGWVRA